MELNRNHYFLLGVVLILLGIQFRYVSAVVLNDKASQFVAQKLGNGPTPVANRPSLTTAMMSTPITPSRRTVELPRWLGYSLISVGSILVLHSIAMGKPGGG